MKNAEKPGEGCNTVYWLDAPEGFAVSLLAMTDHMAPIEFTNVDWATTDPDTPPRLRFDQRTTTHA